MSAEVAGPQPGGILELLPKVAEAIGAVGKDHQANMGGAGTIAFRGIDDLLNACHGALVEHGITVRPWLRRHKVVDRERMKDGRAIGMSVHVFVTVDYELIAPDGSSLTVRSVGEALDTGDKATSKALSGALKYALIQTFTIPTADVGAGDKAKAPEVGGRARGGPAPAGYDRAARNRAMQAAYKRVGIVAREERLEHARKVTGRADLATSKDLTEDELEAVIADLSDWIVP